MRRKKKSSRYSEVPNKSFSELANELTPHEIGDVLASFYKDWGTTPDEDAMLETFVSLGCGPLKERQMSAEQQDLYALISDGEYFNDFIPDVIEAIEEQNARERQPALAPRGSMRGIRNTLLDDGLSYAWGGRKRQNPRRR